MGERISTLLADALYLYGLVGTIFALAFVTKGVRQIDPAAKGSGGSRQVEIPAEKINLGFVLGNKVALGSVNANREYFETGVKYLSTAELHYPGWLKKLLTHPVKGLENYAEMIRLLTETKGAIKGTAMWRQFKERSLRRQPADLKPSG